MEKMKESDKKFRKGDWGIKYLCRGPKIDWGVLLLPPGEKMGEHGHREIEETFYFVEGKGKIIVTGRRLCCYGEYYACCPGFKKA